MATYARLHVPQLSNFILHLCYKYFDTTMMLKGHALSGWEMKLFRYTMLN